jgi:hypothetical protein
MSDKLEVLDKVLDTGMKELSCLCEGQLDEAERLASERLTLMEEAWRMRDPNRINMLKEKLLQLQSLHGQITAEAKKLHAAIKRDLLRARQENKRLTGYRSSIRYTPLSSSKFVDKKVG